MIRLQKILVPTDFSDFSNHAVKYGCEFAKRFNAELHLVSVVEDVYPLVPESGMLLPTAANYLNELKAAAEQTLSTRPDPAWVEGVNVRREVLIGTAFLEIVRYAKDEDIDLVVIGTHGRTGLVHVLMGSVAEKVVRKAPCPVLTVRPEGHDFVMP
ncbi:MAG: universal stress protein [Planctomycetaceae bacterium]|nr:universal stress protein [Planctomycetaceae bacterium]MCA9029668.1 universal stress protein [Planctomycetaceae bacterium]MCA9044368.1 universal stress protein [Planctomycetaceae bacterium]MCB9951355.1 universal stress protein [Planctomycetaceae bacterium]